MKIYRVIPDSFTRGDRLNETDYIGIEDIYYNGGFISFRDKNNIHKANSIYSILLNDNIDKGKYFYLFSEDAVMRGFNLLNGFHNIETTNFIIEEYDIPIDLILKYIGYGVYNEGIIDIYTLETFISKDDIIGVKKNSEQLSIDYKTSLLLKSLKQTLKTIISFKNWADYDYDLYSNFFNVDDLELIIDDDEKIKELIKNSPYYKTFIQKDIDLIETLFITGKSISVNAAATGGFRGWKRTEEYFKSLGLDVDYSEERKEFKNELLYYLEENNIDKEKVKSLLISSNRNI